MQQRVAGVLQGAETLMAWSRSCVPPHSCKLQEIKEGGGFCDWEDRFWRRTMGPSFL